jgi:hypothetical protein
MFGVDNTAAVTLGLDSLSTPLPIDPTRFGGKYPELAFDQLTEARKELYHVLDKLPIGPQHGTAAPWEACTPFIDTALGGSVPWKSLEAYAATVLAGTNLAIKVQDPEHYDMYARTWRYIDDPQILPNQTKNEVIAKTKQVAFNATIKTETVLWKLIKCVNENKNYGRDIDDATKQRIKAMLQEAAINGKIEKEVPVWERIDIPIHRGVSYGRIQVHPGKKGREIHLAGLNELRKGWEVPTLICDATGDAKLLNAIWSQIEEPEPQGWEQLPRPANVRITQCTDHTFSKEAIAVGGKDPEEREQRAEAARRLYAAVLMKALEYGGAEVGVIVYKSTREWIDKNCSVPQWLNLLHWGDVTGVNILQRVRALFVIGRPMAAAEDVVRQAEALVGVHITERDYWKYREHGRIPVTPDANGNCIPVDVWEHLHPIVERLRRQITEGGIIQAAGRARAGLRGENEPLDIHLWTNVPVPELGEVEPVSWGDLRAGPDGLMLATAGCWLRNIADAVKAFEGLFSADALKQAWKRSASPAELSPSPILIRVTYERAGAGCKPAEAVFMKEVSDPRGWLEARLGPLAWCEDGQQRDSAGLAAAPRAHPAAELASDYATYATIHDPDTYIPSRHTEMNDHATSIHATIDDHDTYIPLRHVTINDPDTTIPITRKRGRPPTGKALTDIERQRKRRAELRKKR